ncbi:MAG: FecR domain-containing protein [Planctomycetaceae bacterium]|nr:FecR domain-containing protein [Planctomycetaceae bacterium]
MSDEDLERRLDRMYRSLDESARRVESRWRVRPATRRKTSPQGRPVAGWVGAGIAAAAAIVLLVLALRAEKKPAVEIVQAPIPAVRDVRGTPPPPPAVPPTAPPEAAPVAPKPPPSAPKAMMPPAEPAREEPKVPEPPAPPPPTPPPPADAPPATRVAQASMVLPEIEGTFDLADKALRGKQKSVPVSAGERLRASTAVRVALAEDRFVLLAPRSVVEFRPEGKRLGLLLEQGEALADLVGPGPELRIGTKGCEVTPLGTVFAVKVVPGRSIITVEKGRVEVQSSKGKATLRAAESMQAADDGSLGAAGPADFRTLAWARGHRAAELTLFSEDFSKAGAWEAEVDKGVARAVARPGAAPMLHLAGDRLFEIPVRGALTVVCRSDRASKLKVQLYAGDVRTTYRVDVPLLRSSDWRTLSFSFDDFVPADRTKASGRPLPGAPISDLLLQYGEEDERGTFWVDSIKVTELRP